MKRNNLTRKRRKKLKTSMAFNWFLMETIQGSKVRLSKGHYNKLRRLLK